MLKSLTSSVGVVSGFSLLGFLLLVFGACSSETSVASGSQETVPISSSSAGDVAMPPSLVATSLASSPDEGESQEESTNYPWLQVMEGGILRVPIANGASIPVVDDITAEIFVSPYPPGLRTDLDIYLLQERSGMPVADATVELISNMVFMEHGTSAMPGKSVGEGHYVLPLNFLMYGEWHVELRITTVDGREGSISMVWGVFPQTNIKMD